MYHYLKLFIAQSNSPTETKIAILVILERERRIETYKNSSALVIIINSKLEETISASNAVSMFLSLPNHALIFKFFCLNMQMLYKNLKNESRRKVPLISYLISKFF